uniref:Uncharacterized protein n=1 Tax=Brassica oleracea var. oleracea TaxID=109376 RepID=A0A0D3BCD9_BRAOL
MLNPLWPGFEVLMAGTSAEVPIPPDHEARFPRERQFENVRWPSGSTECFSHTTTRGRQFDTRGKRSGTGWPSGSTERFSHTTTRGCQFDTQGQRGGTGNRTFDGPALFYAPLDPERKMSFAPLDAWRSRGSREGKRTQRLKKQQQTRCFDES